MLTIGNGQVLRTAFTKVLLFRLAALKTSFIAIHTHLPTIPFPPIYFSFSNLYHYILFYFMQRVLDINNDLDTESLVRQIILISGFEIFEI